MTLRISTLSITTHSAMTLSITTLSTKTLSITTLQHNCNHNNTRQNSIKQWHSVHHKCYVVCLNLTSMPSGIMPSVGAPLLTPALLNCNRPKNREFPFFLVFPITQLTSSRHFIENHFADRHFGRQILDRNVIITRLVV